MENGIKIDVLANEILERIRDQVNSQETVEEYKTVVQNQQWMCGFPDKVVVISVENYIVMAYGYDEIIDDLVHACSEVNASSTVLVDAPAVQD